MSPQRRPTGGRGGGGGGRRGDFGRRYAPRRKVCAFCVDKIKYIDYKDVPRLRRYLSERGKIEARRKTGTCARHQRALAVALKRARHVALLPYTTEHIRLSGMTMRSPEDRRRDDRGPRGPMGPRPVAVAEAGDGAATAAEPVTAAAVDTEEAPGVEDGVDAQAPVVADADEATAAGVGTGTDGTEASEARE